MDSIKVSETRKREDGTEYEEPLLMGHRDRALIAVMTYTFARVGAVLKLKVEDYYIQGRKSWMRLHEKGGKVHEVPCHHRLNEYLHEYIAAAGLEVDKKGFCFNQWRIKKEPRPHRSTVGPVRRTRHVRRRATAAGIRTAKIGCHTLRATGITAYMKGGGRLEVAQQIANHESPRTTKLYDRSSDEISLDEVEKIMF